MTEKNARTGTGTAPLRGAELREARLKVALKANMARRKAQAKQRGAGKLAADGYGGAEPETGAEPEAGTEPDTGSKPDQGAAPDAMPATEDPADPGSRAEDPPTTGTAKPLGTGPRTHT